ncbi:hypothetical protein LC048_03455 [Mesobacillus subterraneus]|uniref:hypothetical protein n=1 Tax=Mesobacillus subterraneus TaxID=285983 RepID=UPI00273EA015|nr:hypothetical protein [Mesobacillus subterraneus]WLR56035.1 hypothetical protein LC048_03455 [Mesobacillus subterraneus]
MPQDQYIEDDLAETQDLEVTEVNEQAEPSQLETEALDIILNNEPGPENSRTDSRPGTITEIEFEQASEITAWNDYHQDQEEKEAFGIQKSTEAEGEIINIQTSTNEAEAIDYQQSEEELKVQPADVSLEQTTETEDLNKELEPEQSLDAELKIEAQPAGTKRQLPFNVLMLKQDKRKWEERKASKYPSFMNEGRMPGASKPEDSETHTVLEESSSVITGEMNQHGEEILSAGSHSDFQPMQQEEPPVSQQEPEKTHTGGNINSCRNPGCVLK